MHALIIDDSKTMRLIVGKILKQLGFEVSEAVHGLDALKQLEAGAKPDLALVDWNMPEMGGLEFVRAVRAKPEFADLQMVMVTSESDMHYVTQALENGANEYVMKPFTKETIQIKLEMLGFEMTNASQLPPA